MYLRFVFHLITRVTAWLQLPRREESWKTAEILILRHQLAVLQRRQPHPPEAELGGPGPARGPARPDTESAPPRAEAAGYPGYDRALASRHRPLPLGRQVHARQDWPSDDPAEHPGPGPPASPREPGWG
jgi:hypothetical protein